MKEGSTTILKGVIIILGVMVLAFFALVIPDEMGENMPQVLLPFLVVLYLSLLPFYFALYQVIKLLNYVDQNIAFSKLSVKSLKYIKYSSIVFCGLYILTLPYLFYIAQADDAPGVAALGLILTLGSLIGATFSAVLQKVVQSGIDLKSENELTV